MLCAFIHSHVLHLFSLYQYFPSYITDMAELVDSQASAITEIADKTEASHERAKAGLTQVQQAAGHQPGCSIC